MNLGSFGTSATTPFTGGSGILEPLPNSPQLVLSDSGLGSYYADPTALPVRANDGMGYQGDLVDSAPAGGTQTSPSSSAAEAMVAAERQSLANQSIGVKAWEELKKMKSIGDKWNQTSPRGRWFPWKKVGRGCEYVLDHTINLVKRLPGLGGCQDFEPENGVGRMSDGNGSSGSGTYVPTNDEDDYYMCEEQAIQLCNELGKHRWQYWHLEVVGRYRGWNTDLALDYLWCDRANVLKLVPINGNPSREPVVLYPYKFWDSAAPVRTFSWSDYVQMYPKDLNQ